MEYFKSKTATNFYKANHQVENSALNKTDLRTSHLKQRRKAVHKTKNLQ